VKRGPVGAAVGDDELCARARQGRTKGSYPSHANADGVGGIQLALRVGYEQGAIPPRGQRGRPAAGNGHSIRAFSRGQHAAGEGQDARLPSASISTGGTRGKQGSHPPPNSVTFRRWRIDELGSRKAVGSRG